LIHYELDLVIQGRLATPMDNQIIDVAGCISLKLNLHDVAVFQQQMESV